MDLHTQLLVIGHMPQVNNALHTSDHLLPVKCVWTSNDLVVKVLESHNGTSHRCGNSWILLPNRKYPEAIKKWVYQHIPRRLLQGVFVLKNKGTTKDDDHGLNSTTLTLCSGACMQMMIGILY